MLIRVLLLVAAALLLPACRTAPSATVARMLAGSYSSAEQSKADPEFFEVHLKMAPIWTDRTDGHWLYVEQAMSTALDKPYRQRIYNVIDAGDGAVLSLVYELPNAAERIGAWRDPSVFDADSPERLTKRDGCAIRLESKNGAKEALWVGSTNGKECLSSLRGATYATSEVRMTAGRLETWDRGFDANDQQVWGAKKGPYVFVKDAATASSR
ncbi:MAG: phycocyanobilin lyase CpcT [Planctomycetota bacterium]|jgi:hypothetical protein